MTIAVPVSFCNRTKTMRHRREGERLNRRRDLAARSRIAFLGEQVAITRMIATLTNSDGLDGETPRQCDPRPSTGDGDPEWGVDEQDAQDRRDVDHRRVGPQQPEVATSIRRRRDDPDRDVDGVAHQEVLRIILGCKISATGRPHENRAARGQQKCGDHEPPVHASQIGLPVLGDRTDVTLRLRFGRTHWATCDPRRVAAS